MTDIAHLDIDIVSEYTRQWLEKAVIGLSLCPFVKVPHAKNLVRIVVSETHHLDDFLENLDRELQLLGNTPVSELETILLVHPALFPDFKAFSQMSETVDGTVVESGSEDTVQIVPFHPDFQFGDTEADDTSNYANRSPYPTLRLIREGSIAKAAKVFPDVLTTFGRNIVLLEKTGHEGWDKLDILRCPFPYHRPSENN